MTVSGPTLGWVEKAEHNYRTVCVLHDQLREPLNDMVCFHCQQCGEAYLKAMLTEARLEFPKTHDLGHLLQLACARWPDAASLASMANSLTPYAVEVRYPGRMPDERSCREAVKAVSSIRAACRAWLGLPPEADLLSTRSEE